MRKAHLYVPALPTLRPGMFVARSPQTSRLYYPFVAPQAEYYYFARIAIWVAAGLIELAGGEVLVPSYHHGVEIEALTEGGALLNFYRVGRKWEIDPDDVERRINARTRAIYVTHYAGFPSPVAELREVADRHGLPLIEDCALSLLSKQREKPLGSTGDLSVFSLYKTLPVPNGGALVVNRKDGKGKNYSVPPMPAPPFTSTASHVMSSLLVNMEMRGGIIGGAVRKVVRRLGRSAVGAARIERVTMGSDHFNSDDANIGMSALSRRIVEAQDMDRIVRVRRRNYTLLLRELRDVAPPLMGELQAAVCPLFYPLVVRDKERVMARLAAQGIETIDFWRHFHSACDPAKFPDVAWLRESILEIPCHQDLTRDRVAAVARAVRDVVCGSHRQNRKGIRHKDGKGFEVRVSDS